jgi:hypothetical protein
LQLTNLWQSRIAVTTESIRVTDYFELPSNPASEAKRNSGSITLHTALDIEYLKSANFA